MLVLRCYGFCTVLNSPGWLVSVGVKASVQRTRPGHELREQEESPGAQERERESTLARCFKQSDLDTAHRRQVESECLYGAEPRPCPWFLMISACVI